MSDMLADGEAWLSGQLKAYASESVVYSRDPYDGVELSATRGDKPMRTMSDFGPRVDYTMQDWLIPAADLILGGEAATPRKGDTITATSRGLTQIYEVLSPSPGEPVWRWSGAGEVTLRVHAKLRSEGA